MSLILDGSNGATLPLPLAISSGGTGTATGENLWRNKLINGGMNVWQRGTSFTANGYGPDRFILAFGGTATAIKSSTPTSPNGNYYIQTTTGAASSFCNYTQAIETANVLPLRGKVVTVSAWVQTSGVAFTGTMVFVVNYSNSTDAAASQTTAVTITTLTPVTPSGTWQQARAVFTVPSDAVGLAINLNHSSVQASGVVEGIADFQLEIGSTATSFENRPYGTELALCQRYYEMVSVANGGAINMSYGSVTGYSAAQARATLIFKTTKRTAPTMTYSAAGTVYLQGNSNNIIITAIADLNSTVYADYFSLSATLTNGFAYSLIDAAGASFISASAEL
jgi:hypothetical protein